MSDISNFSRFGNNFQENLVKIIIKERQFSDQFKEVLNVNYFETKCLQLVVQCLYDYKDAYKIHPTIETLDVILREEARKNEMIVAYKQAIEFVEKAAAQDTIADLQFTKDTALDFCKKQSLAVAMQKALDYLEKSSFDSIKKVIDDALKLGVEQNLGHDLVKDLESRFEESKRLIIPTPWPEINDITGGGFGKKEFHIIVAGTGAGKTHAMVDFGAHAILQGFKGVHYTLEMSAVTIGRRYDSRLCGIDINLRKQVKEEIRDEIRKLRGNILIREWPTKSASVNTIRAHLDKCIQNDFKPDFIIIDYADLLKSVGKHTEKRDQLEEINEELRAISMEYNIVSISASQSNRCLQKDEKVQLLTGETEIKNVKVGDQILTHLGYKKITEVFKPEKQPVYKITLSSGKTIKCSANHYFPTCSGETKSIFTGLSEGDKLFVKQ